MTVHEYVTHLAGEPASPGQRHTAHQEPTTDADTRAEIGDVGVTHSGAAKVLGQHPEVGVVPRELIPQRHLYQALIVERQRR